MLNKNVNLISELLELVLNRFLYQNQEWLMLIQFLQGKTLQIEFLELQNPIVLCFDINRLYVFNKWEDQLDCIIRMKINHFFLFIIDQCTIKSINNIPFELKGDFKMVHNLLRLIDEMELNFLKSFMVYVNRLIFDESGVLKKKFLKFFKNKLNFMKLCLYYAITDEWKLVPSLLELMWFYKDIDKLHIQEEYLFERLKVLEKYNVL